MPKYLSLLIAFSLLLISCRKNENICSRVDFTEGWKFYLGDKGQASRYDFDDSAWRSLNLPHDWSIEGEFSIDNPTKINGGALPAGIGWYRKSFKVDKSQQNQEIWMETEIFDQHENLLASAKTDQLQSQRKRFYCRCGQWLPNLDGTN